MKLAQNNKIQESAEPETKKKKKKYYDENLRTTDSRKMISKCLDFKFQTMHIYTSYLTCIYSNQNLFSRKNNFTHKALYVMTTALFNSLLDSHFKITDNPWRRILTYQCKLF